ncbi:hypothetical protein DFQ26_007883, partial [Actinomortierella ambigua]
KFTSISLTIQRAKTYIVISGCGLCLLVGVQLVLVHLVATPRNSRFNTLIHTHVPPTLAQDHPSFLSNNVQQGKPQHQQQQQHPQHVLPSNGWAIPGTGSADATPIQSAHLIESLTSSIDHNDDAEHGSAYPSSADDDTLRTLFHKSTGTSPRPLSSDMAIIDPRRLRRRQLQVGPETGMEIVENTEESSNDDSKTRQASKPIPAMAPIPIYLLPETSGDATEDALKSPQPPSLSTDDLGGPMVVPSMPADPLEKVVSTTSVGLEGENNHPHDSAEPTKDDPPQRPSSHNPYPHSLPPWENDLLTQLESSSSSHGSSGTNRQPSTGFYTVPGFLTVLFVASQAALIGLLTMLFLGVLILTEFVLDREDEDPDARRRCFLYWARGVGIAVATVASAVHGSMLSTYVLLDGQSDWISKAVIASIGFYWFAMIVLMRRVSAPPPWEC